MNDDDLLVPLDDDIDSNPYAAPRANLAPQHGKVGDEEEEQIRRRYLSHEASVKSVGYLSALGAAFMFVVVFIAIQQAMGTMPIAANANGQSTPRGVFAATAVFYLGAAILNIALAYGLIKLQNWARWTMFGLMIFNVVGLIFLGIAVAATTGNAGPVMTGCVAGMLIPAYIIYLMASSKAGMVCSAEYKEIIARTPYIKYKTSIVVWIFLGLVLLLILIGVIGVILKKQG